MTVLVDTPVYHPRLNVCMDALLPRHALGWGEPAARVWFNPPVIVVGRNTVLEENVNMRLAESLGIPVVRRVTGGGAVFHDYGNLNVSVAVPTEERVSPLYVYKRGTSVVLQALERLGLEGWVENHSDVIVDGWKVSGGAAYVSRKYYLYHGTLLVNTDHEIVSQLTPPRHDLVAKGLYTPSKYRPRSLASLLGGVSWGEAFEALLGAIETVFGVFTGISWEDGRTCPAEHWVGTRGQGLE